MNFGSVCKILFNEGVIRRSKTLPCVLSQSQLSLLPGHFPFLCALPKADSPFTFRSNPDQEVSSSQWILDF